MKTLALVIGNNNYINEGVDKLDNAINDANCINSVFMRLGFDTILKTDVSKIDFRDAIDDYINKLSDYEVAIVFYSGHGLQMDGKNYLCGIDLDVTNKTRCLFTSIELEYLIGQLQETSVFTKILILDACRKEPISITPKYRGIITTNSFAPICAPIGTFIAFSTSPGQGALDGTSQNGAYTGALLKHIETKDIPIEEVFKRTRSTLYTTTAGKQISWEHTSLMGAYSFSTSFSSASTSYSPNALSDATYNYNQQSNIIEIINLLRSHDWYQQTTGLKKFYKFNFVNQKMDDLFVLGRNIYQSACSFDFVEGSRYFSNLFNNLLRIPEEARMHIVNGMAYEIYFDSHNKLRYEFKTQRLKDLHTILTNENFVQSANFIINKIKNYNFRVIFDFLNNTNPSIDLSFELKDDIYCLNGIYISGINKMYDLPGSKFFTLTDSTWMCIRDKNYIENEICNKIAANKDSITFNYCGIPEETTKIGYEADYQILNYQLK